MFFFYEIDPSYINDQKSKVFIGPFERCFQSENEVKRAEKLKKLETLQW